MGLYYQVELDNKSFIPHILVPLIKTDGLEKSEIDVKSNGFFLKYRDAIYQIISDRAQNVCCSHDKAMPNRNALYLTGIIESDAINITLKRVGA